ncbi:MAG: hypothetical protein EOP48_30465 [Sphingobacteriales bacterium]|nr:MAG: hypothetical protein EOP48_30465 [Sphingobacteriales bacterium]
MGDLTNQLYTVDVNMEYIVTFNKDHIKLGDTYDSKVAVLRKNVVDRYSGSRSLGDTLERLRVYLRTGSVPYIYVYGTHASDVVR